MYAYAVVALLMVLEGACTHLAYYTLGAIPRVFYVLAVAANFVPLLVIALAPKPVGARLGVALALALATAIVPYQCWLGLRLLRQRTEAEHIVAWADDAHARRGEWPRDLGAYTLADEGLQGSFGYRRLDPPLHGILLYYSPTDDTSYGYSYVTGRGWFYEDD